MLVTILLLGGSEDPDDGDERAEDIFGLGQTPRTRVRETSIDLEALGGAEDEPGDGAQLIERREGRRIEGPHPSGPELEPNRRLNESRWREHPSGAVHEGDVPPAEPEPELEVPPGADGANEARLDESAKVSAWPREREPEGEGGEIDLPFSDSHRFLRRGFRLGGALVALVGLLLGLLALGHRFTCQRLGLFDLLGEVARQLGHASIDALDFGVHRGRGTDTLLESIDLVTETTERRRDRFENRVVPTRLRLELPEVAFEHLDLQVLGVHQALDRPVVTVELFEILAHILAERPEGHRRGTCFDRREPAFDGRQVDVLTRLGGTRRDAVLGAVALEVERDALDALLDRDLRLDRLAVAPADERNARHAVGALPQEILGAGHRRLARLDDARAAVAEALPVHRGVERLRLGGVEVGEHEREDEHLQERTHGGLLAGEVRVGDELLIDETHERFLSCFLLPTREEACLGQIPKP